LVVASSAGDVTMFDAKRNVDRTAKSGGYRFAPIAVADLD
jgi:hypothetical protein